MSTSDLISISVCIVIVVLYGLRRFDDWCAKMSPEEVAVAIRLMQGYQRLAPVDQREAVIWIQKNEDRLCRDLGESVSYWLYGVSDRPDAHSRFLALIERASTASCGLADIDSLWAIYFATGDMAVVDLIAAQARSTDQAVVSKVVWSYESTMGTRFPRDTYMTTA